MLNRIYSAIEHLQYVISNFYRTAIDPNKVNLGSDVFNEVDTNNCTLQVPKGSKALYQEADQWKDFTHIIEV